MATDAREAADGSPAAPMFGAATGGGLSQPQEGWEAGPGGADPDEAPSRRQLALDHLRQAALDSGDGSTSSRLWSALVGSLDGRSRLVVGAVAAAVIAAVLGVAVWWARPSGGPAIGGPGGGAEAGAPMAQSLATIPMASPSTTAAPDVVVHVAGAVANPGVYRMDPRARVGDLVDAAGGLAGDADGDRLNLAAALVDGSRVYVPRRGEASVPPLAGTDMGADQAGSSQPGAAGANGVGGAGAQVDINKASAEALEGLPGIGPATANAIIEHRERRGPFRSVEDLLDVSGIGPAKLDQLRSLVRV